MKIKLLLAAAVALVISSTTHAAFTIDLTGDNAYDDKNPLLIPFIDPVGGSATISLVPTGGSFNSNAGDFGIDDGTEGSSTTDQIDGTDEIVTITFDVDIEFNSIDLGAVGSDSSDGVSFTIAGGSTNLFTGVTDFNGTNDIYSPSAPISLSTGQTIIITGSSATSSFDIQNLNVTVVPEPSAYGLLAGLLGLSYMMLRRRA
jgi:hypothetical protein